MSLQDIIRKHVLKNAFDYGKANPGSIVGKVIGEMPDAKKDMKTTMAEIAKIVAEINKMDKSAIEKEMTNFTYAEKKEEKKGFEVPNAVQGKVITRFPPEPSGYPHIGHAKAAWLDYEIARQYGGKMILRFDDTNPEKEDKEYVAAIKEGLVWLGIEWADETYTSDSIPKIYEAAEKLIDLGKAYVCTCSQDEISKGRTESKACACRSLNTAENRKRWEAMLNGTYGQGQAILRYKGDLAALNTVMRDPSLARILDAPHYKQGTKYKVWPGYDLAVVVMDTAEGITHSMRSKEYELRNELFFALLKDLGLRTPELVEFSRLNIKNAPISKRLLTPLVKEGKVLGWDDPRLPTLKGLARRGILPDAVKLFVLSFGLSKVESEPSWEALLVENRKLLDPVSKHYFFVPEPIKLNVAGASAKEVELKFHPKNDLGGKRKIHVSSSVYIPKKDFDLIKEGETFRLKDLYNAKMLKPTKGECEFAGDGLVEKKLQWVPASDGEFLECEVLAPKDLVDEDGNYRADSLDVIKGVCEKGCGELKVGEVIQFERFGFCRFDGKDGKKLRFVFSC